MEISEFQIHKINSLIEHKKLLNRLYQIYSEKFPEQYDFWLSLSNMKSIHSEWMFSVLTRIKQGEGEINPGRFNNEAIQTSTNYIKTHIEKAISQTLTLREALSTAMQLENAIIEQRFYQIFNNNSNEFNNMVQKFNSEINETRMKIQKLIRGY